MALFISFLLIVATIQASAGNVKYGSKPGIPSTKQELSTFREDMLLAHNRYRAKHDVGALKLSSYLCNLAQSWAEHLASTDTFKHSNNKEFGENMVWRFSATEITGQQATDQWYSEIKNYNFGDTGFQLGTGHFSQVVWKDSKEIGIGKAVAKSGKVYVVANYQPAGNKMQAFQENIFPPQSG
ncbi:Golgi-associated plant pathogenesis-related protein 1-like [Patiria miniata]|uniref:SCP domain-containing protein n=1 Tax=Patiria miniata TaxID=46514 RepID=A0A913Z8W5_PATMI|nr:Golgi-associated plant pathogenesis-related protein 1-like [Patiria miniata]